MRTLFSSPTVPTVCNTSKRQLKNVRASKKDNSVNNKFFLKATCRTLEKVLLLNSSLLSSEIPLPSVVNPGPRGHIFLYWVVPGRGQSSQLVPQPLPPSQQHSDLVTKFLLLEVIWHRVVRTSVKQKPSRLSGGWKREREKEHESETNRQTDKQRGAQTKRPRQELASENQT